MSTASVALPTDVAIIGLARNAAAGLAQSVAKLAAALSGSARVHWMVIESDSSDHTVAVLKQLVEQQSNFAFQSLGRLDSSHPSRTQRIAHCRNVGLDWLESIRDAGSPVTHALMADLDGVNDGLTREALATCWSRGDWDACTANQAGSYYDLWALRHPQWCPADCWKEADFLTEHGVPRDRAKMAAVYTRMIRIPPDSAWLEVDSAFGGLAVYRAEALHGLRYTGLAADGTDLCEHVPLHQGLRARGGRIFINPKLLNGSAGDGQQYWAGPDVARTRRASLRLRIALWLAFGKREGKALRQYIEGLR